MSRKFFRKPESKKLSATIEEDFDHPPSVSQFQCDTSKGDRVINELAEALKLERRLPPHMEINRVVQAGESTTEESIVSRQVAESDEMSVIPASQPLFDYTRNEQSTTPAGSKTLRMITDLNLVVEKNIESQDKSNVRTFIRPSSTQGDMVSQSFKNTNQEYIHNSANDVTDKKQLSPHEQFEKIIRSNIPVMIPRKKRFRRSKSLEHLPPQQDYRRFKNPLLLSAIDVNNLSSISELALLKKKYRDRKYSSQLINDFDLIDKKIRSDVKKLITPNDFVESRLSNIEEFLSLIRLQIRNTDLDVKMCKTGVNSALKSIQNLTSLIEKTYTIVMENNKALSTMKDDILAKIDLTENVFKTTEARILDTIEATPSLKHDPTSCPPIRLARPTKDINSRVKAMACKKGVNITQLRAGFPSLSAAIDTGDEQLISDALISMGEEESERFTSVE